MAQLASGSHKLPGTNDYRTPLEQRPDVIAMNELQAESDQLDLAKGQVVGGILRWQRADGYALYRVTKDRPLTIQHVDFMDGWTVEPALIRGLTKDDVLTMLQRERRLRELFGGKKDKVGPQKGQHE